MSINQTRKNALQLRHSLNERREMKRITQIFTMPSAKECAVRELEMAKRELLNALSTAELAAKLAQYHQGRVTRLSRDLEIGAI